jgi:hypothetical protein
LIKFPLSGFFLLTLFALFIASSDLEISQSAFLLDSVPVVFLFFVFLFLDFTTLLAFHHSFLDLSDPLDVLDKCKLDLIVTLLAIKSFFEIILLCA